MNIAIFASAFYPHFGGVEELVRQLAHQYRTKGHSVIILTNRWPRDLPESEEYEGLPIYRLAMRVPEGSAKARLSYQMTHTKIVQQMLGILKKHDIQMLHVQCISSNGYYALLAKRALCLPLVVTAQGELTMDAGQIYQRSAFMNATLKTLLQEADAVTGCSAKTLRDVEEHAGISTGARGRAIFNGANLDDFTQAEAYAHPRPYILGIGRVVPQKGFDVLIKAYAQVNPVSHDLIIAGDGTERETLEQLADSLGLQERVHFVGRADRPKAVALFNGASFVALPSRADEGLPVVSVEAMAAGKAIAATHVGGVPESILDGENGLIVPRENVGVLAQALTRLVSDPELRERFGHAGRQRAQQFAWPVIADQYLSVYKRFSSK